MGRPKQFTDEQLNQRKQVWEQTRRKKMAARYKTDPSYRAAIVAHSRDSYRSKHSVSRQFAVGPLNHVNRLVAIDSRRVEIPTVSIRQLAEYWGYHDINIYNWITKGFLPSPLYANLTTNKGKQPLYVYSVAQVNRMTDVMRTHLSRKVYLTKKDTDTLDALAQAFSQAD